jgi:hypothetical protein
MEQMVEPRLHPLMKQIDEWEQQSINKIHRAADDARKQLRNTINEHTTKLTEALTNIADELRKGREDDNFFETDLKQWMDKLDQLKKDLAHPTNIKIRQEDNNVIPKIIEVFPANETFGRSIEGIQIEDNGKVIVKKQANRHAGIRGSGEYVSGQYRFRFKIEEYSTNKLIFIGILSKGVAMEPISFKSQSSYGWAGLNRVYRDGTHHDGFNGYKSDIEKNDIVELLVDCDQRMIRLTNERTQSVYELQIDTNKCPFPWQLNFNLYYLNDRIRIL